MQFTDCRYIDSHCHFDFIEFNADRASLWQACNAKGITHLLIPGVTPDQWQTAAQLCAQYSGLFYAAGLHPHWIEQQSWFKPDNDNLLDDVIREKIATSIQQEFSPAANVNAAYCLAVGECGLDKMISTSVELQQQLLVIHIEVANQLQKPLIIHCVKAHNELIAVLKKHKPKWGGVIHAFSGSYEIAQEYVGLRFYLGVGGTITYERAQKTRTAVTKIPLDWLVLETDAPDMPLQGKQGQRNSPEYIPQIAEVLADLRGVTPQEIAEATSRNAMRLFHCS